MKINWKAWSNSPGYQTLKNSALHDIESANKSIWCGRIPLVFNSSKPSNRYDRKFKWVIDRVKHYSYVTGISYITILDAWESGRNYWYMNYYQECNQPKLNRKDVLIINTREINKEEVSTLEYICPSCRSIGQSYSECCKCDWKSYGFLGTLGKGLFVFDLNKCLGMEIFMPANLSSFRRAFNVQIG